MRPTETDRLERFRGARGVWCWCSSLGDWDTAIPWPGQSVEVDAERRVVRVGPDEWSVDDPCVEPMDAPMRRTT